MTAKTFSGASARVNTLLDLLEPVCGLPGGSGAIVAGSDNESNGPALLAGLPSTVVAGPDCGPPAPGDFFWHAFTRDHSEDDAAAAFRRRYGQLPRYVFDGLGGLLLVGPIPDLEGGA